MQINTNNFTSYSLTPEEELSGFQLTSEQRAIIQNDMAKTAIDKLHLKYDPEHPLLFLQKEADLAGQLVYMQHLLDRADAALEAVAELSRYQDGPIELSSTDFSDFNQQ